MAQTYTHSDNVLSKVKFGNTTYYLKDADVRSILDTFGDVVTSNVASSITEDGTGLVTAGQIYDYVGRQVGTLGTVLNLLSDDDHTEVDDPATGDFVVEEDGTEWLYDGSEWRVVGDESSYVMKTTTIAGVDLQDSITATELKTALGLKALAYKDNGSVAITTIDSMNAISTGAAGTYSVSSTPVSVPATYSALDVTPAGSVAVTAGTAAAASYDKTTSVSISAAAPGDGVNANYTPAGSVTVTDVTVTPSTASVATVTDAGTAYQLTAGSCVKDSDTTSAFATEGITASVGTGEDAETLIFSSASTSNAVTASGGITYTNPTLSGALPTFGSQTALTGITSASATASFSGTGMLLSATPAYTSTNASMTQPTFTAEFTGTSKNVTPAVATTVSAAGTDGSVTVASENITPTYNSSEKTATVNFGVANS